MRPKQRMQCCGGLQTDTCHLTQNQRQQDTVKAGKGSNSLMLDISGHVWNTLIVAISLTDHKTCTGVTLNAQERGSDWLLGRAAPDSSRLTGGRGRLDLTRSGDVLALARHVAAKLVLRALALLAAVPPAPVAAAALLAAGPVPRLALVPAHAQQRIALVPLDLAGGVPCQALRVCAYLKLEAGDMHYSAIKASIQQGSLLHSKRPNSATMHQ